MNWPALVLAIFAAVLGSLLISQYMDQPSSLILSFIWGLTCGIIAMVADDNRGGW